MKLSSGSSFSGWRGAIPVLLLFVVLTVLPVTAAELPGFQHIWINVANDAGVKYDWDGAYYGDANNNSYYIKYDSTGANQLWISTDTVSYQVTETNQKSGTFYVRTTGGRGTNDDVLLLLSVQDPIPDDFAVHIKSSGYVWTPPTPGPYTPARPADAIYDESGIDEIFTKADFIYGPQTWKPAGDMGQMPLYAGQSIADPSTNAHLMFIDLNVGTLKTGDIDNGAAKVEYVLTNMPTTAAFNVYGWTSASNQDEGISWTNLVSSSSYVVNQMPIAKFTVDKTGGTVPLDVQFTDGSTGEGITYSWDFGDGSGSTIPSPAHTYTAAGTYNVKLTVTNAAGSDIETVIITVMPVTAPGAEIPWSKFGGDISNTGQSRYVGPQAPVLKWTFVKNSVGTHHGSAVIGADGTIYIGQQNGANFYAIYPNGMEKWVHPSATQSGGGATVTSTAAIGADGTIYYGDNWGSTIGYLYALNPDGTEKWRNETGGGISGSPAIAPDGTIIVARGDKRVYAYNPDGSPKWTSEPRTGTFYYSCPAIGPDGTIYIPNYEKYLTAYYPENGTVKWSAPMGATTYGGASIATDGTIYVGNYGSPNKLTAFNPDGTVKWSNSNVGPFYETPAIAQDGTIYLGSTNGNVYAFNPDGTQKWVISTGGAYRGSATIGADGTIYIENYGDGKVYALDSVNGAVKWSYQIRDHASSITGTPSIAADGTLYVISYGNFAGYGIYDTLFAFHDPVTPPVAGFTAAPVSGPAPLAVQFIDASTSSEKLTYAWDFDNDGNVDSTEQSPLFTYANPGTFDVSLTVTNSAGPNTMVKEALVTVDKPIGAPEFPVVAFPAALIVGMLGTVLLIRRTREN